jgi:hypothetical protein
MFPLVYFSNILIKSFIRYDQKGLLCTFLVFLNTEQRQTYFASGPEGISIHTFHIECTISVKFDKKHLHVIQLSIDELSKNRRWKGLNYLWM